MVAITASLARLASLNLKEALQNQKKCLTVFVKERPLSNLLLAGYFKAYKSPPNGSLHV